MVYEKAKQSVGIHMKSTNIWKNYINFETSRNNLAVVNQICYQVLKTPLVEQKIIYDLYRAIIESLFERIFEATVSSGSSQDELGLIKVITDECKGDKNLFLKHI